MKVSVAFLIFLSILLSASCIDYTTGPKKPHGWRPMDSGTTNHLHGIWSFSARDVFAVGDSGTILHYNGRAWTAMLSGTDRDLADVWGTAPDNVFVTGDAGTILHYDGSEWSAMESTVSDPIGRMWGHVSGVGGYSLYAVVENGPTAILSFSGPTWNGIRRPVIPGIERFVDVTGVFAAYNPYHPRRLVLVGENGGAFLYDNDFHEWSVMETGVDEDLVGVWGNTVTNLLAVGTASTLLRFNGQEWTQIDNPAGADLCAVAAKRPDDIFVAGAFGRILNYDYCAFGEMNSRTTETINDMWAQLEGSVFAAGDNGTILRYDGRPASRVCPDNVVIRVESGDETTIKWWPACSVSKVIVLDENEMSKWFIAADGNSIEPGVVYGVTPDCAVELRPAAWSLEDGGIHRVLLVRSDDDHDLIVGMWNFEVAVNSGGSRVTAGDDPTVFNHMRYFQTLRLMYPDPGLETMTFSGVDRYRHDDLVTNVRPVRVLSLERDPETGELVQLQYLHLVAATIDGHDVVFGVSEQP